MSNSARLTAASCVLMLMPPIRSDAFSLFASQRAAALEAPWSDSANTDEPLADGVVNASAWIDTNRSAPTRRAFCTRTFSGTKKSASRVIIARMLGAPSIFARSFFAMSSATCFS